ncbi:PhzF family phenazine biosynthesis protein [Aquibacillus rhizosphaerae]|uniref:PhzF family phenazine biosynthesis protein n=1 Tax=Aquibacillus rhizosphaerae TaxID=3051431 RepID=A0ABT7LB32_9BACI|nr:PhzF family phenazine biosynthesis protein [Aquibacillus sp. LR5S19]MDL4843062.1 PhzF family phenazine biosynthesis protein [Aquibacillus sp. LR5S19]
MKTVKVYHYDAFCEVPGKGNPAGVVLNGENLTENEMQEIAFKVGFNETAFVINSTVADLRIRFFTPGHEMNLCGHATMATISALWSHGLLVNQPDKVTIETKAGILRISIKSLTNHDIRITMSQGVSEFEKFNGSINELAKSLGLEKHHIEEELPVLYGSTGVWTLLVPIKELKSFKKMNPKNNLFPSILNEIPKASVHPFCLETYDTNASMHARHFSSPFSGTKEDPVTGTASGVMGAYYVKYISNGQSTNLIVEQGHEIGKDGRVVVNVSQTDGKYDVEITGNAVYVSDFLIVI